MLPHDTQGSAAGQQPSDPAAPGDPGVPPTGLVDDSMAPVDLTPVVPTVPDRRRGWPFAMAMVLVAIMGGGALFLSGYTVGRDNGRSPTGAASEADAWKPFWSVYDAIRTQYPLEPVDRQTLIEGAIGGMVEAVGDPYSSYLSPEDYRGTLDDISGTFEGIGAEIGSVDANGNTSDCATFGDGCHLVIITPINDSPAEKAGLKPGDVIATIDGSTLDGLSPDEARDRVRGKAGTEVKLHVLRYAAPTAPAGSPSPSASPTPRKLLEEFDVTIVRAKIQRREVDARELAGGTVGYVHLAGFSSAAAADFKAALQKDVDKGIKKIVFDLRGNPGGFLLDALDVASQFIGEGPIYWQEDAQGKQLVSDAKAGGVATDASIQVAVLIDRGSASASEIVAGALQDRGRAQLIGETSFGKGTVQQWFDLTTLGGVKLTVSKWLTPNKRWIHKIGLTPDVPVTVPTDTPAGEDPVLDKALEVLGASESAATALPRAA